MLSEPVFNLRISIVLSGLARNGYSRFVLLCRLTHAAYRWVALVKQMSILPIIGFINLLILVTFLFNSTLGMTGIIYDTTF